MPLTRLQRSRALLIDLIVYTESLYLQHLNFSLECYLYVNLNIDVLLTSVVLNGNLH